MVIIFRQYKIHSDVTSSQVDNEKVNKFDLTIEQKNLNLLFPYVSNFDKLTLEHVPSGIYGQVYQVGDKYLIAQRNKLIEYDPITKTITRQSDPSVLNCFYRSVMISNLLYVFCNGTLSDSPRGVYVIDPIAGKIIKTYKDSVTDQIIGNDTPRSWETVPNLINGTLASKGDILWIGTWNGVFRLNTSSDDVQFYDQQKLSLQGCRTNLVYTNGQKIWVAQRGQQSCTGGVSILDETTNTWKAYGVDSFETLERTDIDLVTMAHSNTNIYLGYTIGSQVKGKPNYRLTTLDDTTGKWTKVIDLNSYQEIRKISPTYIPNATIVYDGDGFPEQTSAKLPTNVENLPEFMGLSNMVNGHYYLFTADSIFTLSKDTFPKFLKKLPATAISLNGQKTYVSDDEKYAVLAGTNYGAFPQNPPHSVVLINLQNNIIHNLTKYASKSIDFADGVYIPTLEGVILQNKTDNTLIFKVDFSKKSVSFD